MTSWQDYHSSEKLLVQVEQTYAQLLRFEETHSEEEYAIHHMPTEDTEQVSDSVMKMIQSELKRLPGKVYYWLFPFYPGNFHILTQALERAGVPIIPSDSRKARQAFYQFFLTLPPEQRQHLNGRLKNDELVRRSEELRVAIDNQKQEIRELINVHHAN